MFVHTNSLFNLSGFVLAENCKQSLPLGHHFLALILMATLALHGTTSSRKWRTPLSFFVLLLIVSMIIS
jgi:hypothetical protein